MNNKLLILMTSIVSAFFVCICIYSLHYNTSYPSCELMTGWNITYNGKLYKNVNLEDLDELIGNNFPKGKELVMRTRLPDLGELPLPSIRIYARFCAVKVTSADVLLTEAFQEELKKGDAVGCGHIYVPLPQKYQGCDIVISYTSGENTTFKEMLNPILGDYHDLRMGLLHMYLFPFLTGIFLFIFGALFLSVALVFYPRMHGLRGQLFSSLFTMDIGLWMTFYFKVGNLIISLKYTTDIEYVALFLLVPLSFILFGNIMDLRHRNGYRVIAAIGSVLALTFIVLHYTNILHMINTLKYVHLMGLVIIIIIFYYSFFDKNGKKLSPSNRILMNGFSFLGGMLIFGVLIYQFRTWRFIELYRPDRFVMPIGALVNTFCLLINYYLYIAESYARQREYSSLTHLAYADGLTDLPNRAKSDSLMEELDSASEPYSIVSLDLNGLKEINDVHGHATGDRYIVEFAMAIKECLGEGDFCARIGGDEFIIITKNTKTGWVDERIGILKNKLQTLNATDPMYTRSFASGYASSSEFEKADSHSVYLLADQRMYANKRQIHKALGLKSRS